MQEGSLVSSLQNELERLVDRLNRQPPSSDRVNNAVIEQSRDFLQCSLMAIVTDAISANASDILLVAGTRLVYRVNGNIRYVGGVELTEADIRSLLFPLLSSADFTALQTERSVDFAFQSPGGRRLRVNLHYQQKMLAAAIRILPRGVPRLAALGLPPQVGQLAALRRGLILVTGPTGSGKTTTLAGIVDEINRSRECHIVTIEDPVEFIHSNGSSIIEQIEVGIDTPNFNNSIRSILRQSPDVILVGEMRDAETISLVLTAAETGHLVLSTLHTNDVAQCISRIVDAAPVGSQNQIRQQLSLSLAGVINQQLVLTRDGRDRCPACEILLGSDAIRNLIRHGQDHQLRSQIVLSKVVGMITMEQSLAELVQCERITPETALAHCFRLDEMRALLPGH